MSKFGALAAVRARRCGQDVRHLGRQLHRKRSRPVPMPLLRGIDRALQSHGRRE